MKTMNQAPWVPYLEIDESTGERILRDDTPEEIRRKYEEYLAERESQSSKMLPK